MPGSGTIVGIGGLISVCPSEQTVTMNVITSHICQQRNYTRFINITKQMLNIKKMIF